MIGSRPTKVAWPALLGLLALLVFCSSASARDVYVANSGDGTVSVLDTDDEPPSSGAVHGRRRTGRRRDHPRRALRLGRRPHRGLGLGDRHEKRRRSSQGPIAVGLRRAESRSLPNGARAYVTNSGDDTVTVLNTGTFAHGR